MLNKLESTTQQLEEFKQSAVWRDIQFVLERFIETIHLKMETCDVEELRYNQGAIGKVRDMLELPDELISLKEDVHNG